jgi:hypothetical protein
LEREAVGCCCAITACGIADTPITNPLQTTPSNLVDVRNILFIFTSDFQMLEIVSQCNTVDIDKF